MKLEDILLEWEQDSKIDPYALDKESLKLANLHAKYLKHLTENRFRLKNLRIDRGTLYLLLYRYFNGEFNNKADAEAIGREPVYNKILKNEIPMYIDGDKDMIALLKRIAITEEKVEALKEIMTQIDKRGFTIKNALDFHKLSGGFG